MNESSSSGSLSSFITSSPVPDFDTLASSLTLSVSFTALGSSFTPVTVIVMFASAVPPLPSDTS